MYGGGKMPTVYLSPSFFSLNYWLWNIMYMLLGTFLFALPAMKLNCDFRDIEISLLLGLNFGTLLAIVSSIMPFYMVVFTLIPLVIVMVR